MARNEKGKSAFPWDKLAVIKARVLKAAFEDLDGLLEDLSEDIFSLQRNPKSDPMDADEIEEDIFAEPVEDEFGLYPEDDVDFEGEYGADEYEDQEDKSTEEEKESWLEMDFGEGLNVSEPAAELEICEEVDGFSARVNTGTVCSKWYYSKTGSRKIDNAGLAALAAIDYRAEILQNIGDYFIKELESYLQNIHQNDRHWHLKPLRMNKILKDKDRSTISRVIGGTRVLLPNGEMEYLHDFFGKENMPISSRAIACAIGRLLADKPDIKNPEISEMLQKEGEKRGLSVKLTPKMVGTWRRKYNIL